MTPRTEAVSGVPAALVSIHDLMPSTMPAVRRTLGLVERMAIQPVTLLVVPGLGWSRGEIRELRAMQRAGHALAGHGWLHRAGRFGNLYHWFHGMILSRRVAEHLALDTEGIIRLINRCYDWFGNHDLALPRLYVPPAWAMGPIRFDRLAVACPFRLYETFAGLVDGETGDVMRIPMVGYEADTLPRVPALRVWNAVNRRLARGTGLLRIGIHPADPDLRLRQDLINDLERYRNLRDYGPDVLVIRS